MTETPFQNSSELRHDTAPIELWETISASKTEIMNKAEQFRDPKLQQLANEELAELQALETQYAGDKDAIAEGRKEFQNDLEAFKTLELFSDVDGYDTFVDLLASDQISEQEQEKFYEFISANRWRANREFSKTGFPITRNSYLQFAEKFGIQTSSEISEKSDAEAKNLYLKALPQLQSISDVPEANTLMGMLQQLQTLEGSDAQIQMQEIAEYLVGQDGKSGTLDSILSALKRKDAENIANGNPTRYFETFVKTARDFSPMVADRIAEFEARYEDNDSFDRQVKSASTEAIIQWAVPDTADVQKSGSGAVLAKLEDGLSVTVSVDGETIDRSIQMDGAGISVGTDVEGEDFSDATKDYEAVHGEIYPKKRGLEQALDYLENTQFAEVPLEEMQDGLRKILGYTQYHALGLAGMNNKQAVIQFLKSGIVQYAEELDDAKRVFEAAMQQATARNRERYRDNDEKIKTSLRALKNSGLGLLGLDILLASIKAGMVSPDIWAPIDRQNFDLGHQNFWELGAESSNPVKHIEYIYRFANKIMTGNPEGKVDGELVGFSLEQAKTFPDVPQKTESEVRYLLQQSGVWDETLGADQVKLAKRLEEPNVVA